MVAFHSRSSRGRRHISVNQLASNRKSSYSVPMVSSLVFADLAITHQSLNLFLKPFNTYSTQWNSLLYIYHENIHRCLSLLLTAIRDVLQERHLCLNNRNSILFLYHLISSYSSILSLFHQKFHLILFPWRVHLCLPTSRSLTSHSIFFWSHSTHTQLSEILYCTYNMRIYVEVSPCSSLLGTFCRRGICSWVTEILYWWPKICWESG